MKTILFSSVMIGFLVFSGCSKSNSDSGSGLDSVPIVAPIVDSAAPAALKANATGFFFSFNKLSTKIAKLFGIPSAFATAPSDANIKSDLQSIFKGTYGKLSGGDATGYINSLLEDLDGRMSELKTRFAGKTVTCMNNASKSFNLDLSSVNEAFQLSLDLQCKDMFGGAGDQSYAGSGMAFGKNSDGDYSLWLGLNHSATSGFGYAAKVSHPDSDTDKTVDLIFVEGEAQFSRATIAKLRAKPSSNSYELVYRSTSPNAISPISGGSSTSLGYSLDLISDGTLIYVQGVYWTSGQNTCGVATPFTACLNASDLSTATDDCTTLSNSFTIATRANLTTMSCPTIPTPSVSELTFFNAIQISSADTATSAVASQ